MAKHIPKDILEVMQFLSGIKEELADSMTMEFEELDTEFRASLIDWKNNDKEPDWSYYRIRLNEMCDDDGMPRFFNEDEGED
jgi:hypothetical protein